MKVLIVLTSHDQLGDTGLNRLILELTGGDTAIREGIDALTIHSSKDQRAAP